MSVGTTRVRSVPSLAAQCDDLRARLTEQVPKLSGVEIGTIDILVSRVVNKASTTKELN